MPRRQRRYTSADFRHSNVPRTRVAQSRNHWDTTGIGWVNWERSDGVWSTHEVTWVITSLPDNVIWEIVTGCCMHADVLPYGPRGVTEAERQQRKSLGSLEWLVRKPAFIAVVYELARRRLTLPTDISEFINRSLFSEEQAEEEGESLPQTPVPWRSTEDQDAAIHRQRVALGINSPRARRVIRSDLGDSLG